MPICFTFDIDWAPEFMIDELAATLRAHALPATVFCTHESEATRRLLALPHVEAGLHPNFLVHEEDARVLANIRGLFPTARAARSHALYFHSRLLPLLHRAGVELLSNELRFLEPNLAPRYDWSGMVRLPIYWEDDVACVYFDGQLDVGALQLERGADALQVLNFHPVHIYLNTGAFEGYERAKPHLRDEARARSLRQAGPGVRSVFEAAIAATASLPRRRLGEVADALREARPYRGAYAAYLAVGASASTGPHPQEER